MEISQFVSLMDFEEHARAVLPTTAADYFRSGAWGEVTLRENRDAWDRMQIHYRVLTDVSKRNLRTTVLGEDLSMPVMIAPTAMQCMAHPDGELATVRAAGAEETPMILSSLSTTLLDDVCAAARSPVWMQIYLGTDRGFVRDLAQRAYARGCKALVLTVDNPVWGMRERDVRNHFCVPAGMRIVNLERPGGPTGHTGRGIGESLGWAIDASLSWKDFEWLRDATPLPVLIKGICRAEDAVQGARLGAKGIMVSNHGGRQLDTAPATAEVLEPIVQAVAGGAEVIVDGGIRRGTDIVKALALGANAVAVGRPVLWGLAAAGEQGVRRVLQLLRAELDTAMALSGVTDVRKIPRGLIAGGAAGPLRALSCLVICVATVALLAGCTPTRTTPEPAVAAPTSSSAPDSAPATVQSIQGPARLHVTIEGARPNQGPVRCAIYSSKSSFLTREGISQGASIAPVGSEAQFDFHVQSGQPIVVSVFQDINRNDKLDRGPFGVPSEPWGFSGASEFIGPPTWDACVITPTAPDNRIVIKLIGATPPSQAK